MIAPVLHLGGLVNVERVVRDVVTEANLAGTRA
jgi:hypothetical protein